jgi:hypothetical protein
VYLLGIYTTVVRDLEIVRNPVFQSEKPLGVPSTAMNFKCPLVQLVGVSIACVWIGCVPTATAQYPALQPQAPQSPSLPTYPSPHVAEFDLATQQEIPIQRFRKSFYQGAEVLGGYLLDTGDQLGGLDMTFEEARVSFGVPLGSLDNILGIRPYFRATHLNGPETIDVPGTVYETGVTLLNQKKWSPKVSTTLVVSPAIRSDFTTSENALRIFGLGLMNFQCSDSLRVSLGAVFLDREDVSLLPALGFTWTPSPDFKVDGMIPRPRIAKRLWKQGGEAEGWAYLGGSFGGNSWAVSRDDGTVDQLTIRDFRLLAGYEVLRAGNRGMFIEGGYAFGRSLEYTSDEFERDLDDGIFVQASWRF